MVKCFGCESKSKKILVKCFGCESKSKKIFEFEIGFFNKINLKSLSHSKRLSDDKPNL